jgi:hypothetical protein
MHNIYEDVALLLQKTIPRKVFSGNALHGLTLCLWKRGNDEETDRAPLPMGVLYQYLCDEKKHAFLKVERPDVNSAGVLDIVVKKLLRLEDSQEVPEVMRVLN